jgi:hypothetical protein
MLTIFTAPKPFVGHVGIIQRNSLRSWMLLHPKAEVIVFGDEPGIAETCRELELRHEGAVPRNEFGTPRVNHLFTKVREIARHEILCYSNCDIILPPKSFLESLTLLSKKYAQFLMVGRRWDLDVTAPHDFSRPSWSEELQVAALGAAHQRPAWWIDYFVFRGSFLEHMPPFAVGRPAWDNWFIWNALSKQVPVVDASQAVIAVHQNHSYSHHPAGEKGVAEGPEAVRNRTLAGGASHLSTIDACTHEITPAAEVRARSWRQRQLAPVRFFWARRVSPLFYLAMDQTLALRSHLGLRRVGWLGGILKSRSS